MKKKIIPSVLLLSIIFITGCGNKYNQIDGISMLIKEGTLTNTGATIIITDVTKKDYTYGEEFFIEKKELGIWKKLKCKNCWFNLVGYSVNENSQLELKQNWKNMYGSLKKGTYRLVKTVNNEKIAVQFEIK